MSTRKRGFTLVELMIAIVIIGILAGLLVVRVQMLTRKTRESTCKHSLGALRSVLSIYYADNQSLYPAGAPGIDASTLSDALVPTYIKAIPKLYVYPYFEENQSVDNLSTDDFAAERPDDNGHFFYVSDPSSAAFGTVVIGCYEQDSKGKVWSDY